MAIDKEKVMELREQGMTYKQIAEEIGVSTSYIKKIFYEERIANGHIPGKKDPPPKRKPGRPKGAKNKPKLKPYGELTAYDASRLVKVPGTDAAIAIKNNNDRKTLANIGDEKVSAFVAYHIEMAKMRIGVNKRDVNDLYARFFNYLKYCEEHGIIPNNMNCYYALGLDKGDIYRWSSGGTDEAHKQFAEMIKQFFASVHEQAPTQGLMNPISAIFWQKAHDGMIEAQHAEPVKSDPFGEKQSAEEIAAKYAGVELPD